MQLRREWPCLAEVKCSQRSRRPSQVLLESSITAGIGLHQNRLVAGTTLPLPTPCRTLLASFQGDALGELKLPLPSHSPA